MIIFAHALCLYWQVYFKMDELRTVDVLVAGAGPAGSVCGYLLKKSGVDCLVVDRCAFPRDKVCAGGLTPKSWRFLDGLMPDLKYEFNAINHIRVNIDGKVDCEFDTAQPIRIVQRKVFDNALLNEYLSIGGTFLQDALVSVEELDGKIIATLRSGRRVACRYLVGADGSNSRVRRYLKPDTDRGMLVLERYARKRDDRVMDLKLSREFDGLGYYFRFPNPAFDAVGFSDESITLEKFNQVMDEQGIDDGLLRGAYLYLSNDYPLHDRICLIGDAGGFANRTTCEGLYDAFATARNAWLSITTGKPFRKTNRDRFRKIRREMRFQKFFYSKFSFWLLKRIFRHPRLAKACLDWKLNF